MLDQYNNTEDGYGLLCTPRTIGTLEQKSEPKSWAKNNDIRRNHHKIIEIVVGGAVIRVIGFGRSFSRRPVTTFCIAQGKKKVEKV